MRWLSRWFGQRTHASRPSAPDAGAQLRLAIDVGNIATWRHDLISGRIYYDQSGQTVLDIPPHPEGIPIEDIRELIHPDDLAAVVAASTRAADTDKPADVEARYRRAAGGWRHVLTRRVAQRDTHGRVVAFLGVAMDVTDRVEESRQAVELARRLEATAASAKLGIWCLDTLHGQSEWNAQMYRLFGLTPGPRPPRFEAWLQQCVHPDDQARVRDEGHAWIHSTAPVFEVEYRVVLPSGEVRWLMNRSDTERRSSNGQLFGITLDITDRRMAHEALRAASERAVLAMRGAGIGTWEQGNDESQAVWDEQMFRLRGIEPRPQAPSQAERLSLIHEDDRDTYLRGYREARDTGRSYSHEFRVKWPSGAVHWLATRSAAVFDDTGRVRGRIGVNWDITEAKNAETARQEWALALQENQAKSQFLARMSHELRTPLNAIIGFAQLQLTDADAHNPQQLARRMSHIVNAGQHLLSLINDVLDFSSVEADHHQYEPTSVSIGQIVAQCVPLIESQAQERQITLHLNTLDLPVRADATRLRQVVLNLLSNAIKYNREGGTVTLETRSVDKHVALLVRDTGLGMTATQLGQLFEPFNRLGRQDKGIEGTGIGLAIVKTIVERMNGTVTVRSEVNVGTEFEVRLPRGIEATPTLAPSSKPGVPSPPPVPPTETARVLYIEDNPVNVMIVTELIARRNGMLVESAPDGTSGLALAQTMQPDLILLDMQLPDFTGTEVLQQLRADARTAHIPCIALSANAMQQDIDQALQHGFNDYWTKPLDFKHFNDSLDALFGVSQPTKDASD